VENSIRHSPLTQREYTTRFRAAIFFFSCFLSRHARWTAKEGRLVVYKEVMKMIWLKKTCLLKSPVNDSVNGLGWVSSSCNVTLRLQNLCGHQRSKTSLWLVMSLWSLKLIGQRWCYWLQDSCVQFVNTDWSFLKAFLGFPKPGVI